MFRAMLIVAALFSAGPANALEVDFAELSRLYAPCLDPTAKPINMIVCMKKAGDPYWYSSGLSPEQIAAGEANHAKLVSEYAKVEAGEISLIKWMREGERRERALMKSWGIRYPKIEPAGWRERPKASLIRPFFPRAALVDRIDGSVKLKCVVTEAGVLEKCEVTSETPANYHFGASALALAPHLKFKPLRIDGKPIPGLLLIVPITYKYAGFFKMVGPSEKELAEAFVPPATP